MLFWSVCFATLLLSAKGSAEHPQVTCGSVIKLAHGGTRFLLHSHEIAYGSGSGQQSVTGSDKSDDANSLWIVRGAQGTGLKSGSHIRLQHASTRKWLHSHHFQSPLSGNQEVSAFGGDQDSDDGDVWKVQWDKGPVQWTQDQKVRLRHVQTDVYLASGNQRYNRPIFGQTEVFGRGKSDSWVATEGVYFSQQTA